MNLLPVPDEMMTNGPSPAYRGSAFLKLTIGSGRGSAKVNIKQSGGK